MSELLFSVILFNMDNTTWLSTLEMFKAFLYNKVLCQGHNRQPASAEYGVEIVPRMIKPICLDSFSAGVWKQNVGKQIPQT